MKQNNSTMYNLQKLKIMIAMVGAPDFCKISGFSRQKTAYLLSLDKIKPTTSSGKMIDALFCNLIHKDFRADLYKKWESEQGELGIQDGSFFASHKNLRSQMSANAPIYSKEFLDAMHNFLGTS